MAKKSQEEARQDKSKEEQLKEIGACAMASIREMVAALECDYERLEELREERDNYEPSDGEERLAQTECATMAEQWVFDNPDEAAELKALEDAAGECESEEDARERIQEDPLSVQVRGDWHDLGAEDDGPVEYELLLSTGGPATRIRGELEEGNPVSATLQAQDWFTPWQDYIGTEEDRAALLVYAGVFYFEC